MRRLHPLALPTHLRDAINNRNPKIDFITRAIESNVGVADKTMLLVEWSNLICILKR